MEISKRLFYWRQDYFEYHGKHPKQYNVLLHPEDLRRLRSETDVFKVFLDNPGEPRRYAAFRIYESIDQKEGEIKCFVDV